VRAVVMDFCSGPPMQFLSGVDNRFAERDLPQPPEPRQMCFMERLRISA
jgi:hypothetical protein